MGGGAGVGVTGGGEGLGWKGSCEQEWDELGVGMIGQDGASRHTGRSGKGWSYGNETQKLSKTGAA